MFDLNMLKVDGLEVLGQIKANELTRAIPIVVLTSSNQCSNIERVYSLGADSYNVKPVKFDEFARAVTDLRFYWLLKNQTPV